MRFALVATLLCLCLLPTPARANEWSRALADPEGQAYGNRLLDALREAGGNAESPKFLELFRANPNLSRRAYVAIVEQSLEPGSADAAGPYLLLFAKLIDREFGDPLPWRNLQGSRDVKELVGYLDTLRPALAKDQYYADRAWLADQDWSVYKPRAVKAMRALWARTLANEQVSIAELDGLETVDQVYQQAWSKLGHAPAAQPDQSAQRTYIAFLRLASIANLGLLDDFDAGLAKLLRGDVDAQQATYLMLAGCRAAILQQRPDLARRYVAIAREAASTASPPNPVLEYAVRTAEYRLRRLEGYRPTEAQARQDFLQAWSALENYQPWRRWTHDRAWVEGRFATRAWLEELGSFPGARRDIGPRIVRLFSDVIRDPAAKRLENELTGKAGLLYLEETMAYYTLMLAGLDQITYVAEVSPDALPASDRTGFAIGLKKDIGALRTFPERLELLATGPEFPPYPVDSQGLLVELEARADYLWASSAEDISETERAGGFIRAANLVHGSGSAELAVRYLILCGQGLARLGRHDDALSCWKEASALAESWSLARGRLDSATLLAQEYERRQDWANAALHAGRAIDLFATAAPAIGTQDAQAREMSEMAVRMTELSIKAAVATDEPARALEALSRSQQAQSASLRMEGEDTVRAEALSNQQREEQVAALAQKVKSLEAMPASPTRDALLAPARTLLASNRAEFLADTRKLRQKYSEIYGKALRIDPLNLPEAQKSLPGDVAVIEYFPTDDFLYTFVVTQKSLRLHQVAVDRKSLNGLVTAYVRNVRRAVPGDLALARDSQALYQILLAPLEQDLAGCQTLVTIPTGRLNVLPFASLLDPSGVPLGAGKRLLVLARPTDLTRIASEKPRSIATVTAFANATGDLPAAAHEGEEIVTLFPEARVFQGDKATREAFMQFGGQTDALHLATHGEWNLEDSLQNHLAMAQKQKVSQDEIFGLDLDRTSLVILSACNTAMGDGGDVSYVASLAEAFWVAGSQSVIASLWAVNDESTSLLMREFYKALTAGASKVEALHLAQEAVRSKPEFAHPYYWSGFVLFGDWR